MSETIRVGKRGTLTLPAALRKRLGLDEGSLVIAEERDDGVFLRPARALPVETYTPERIAEFLLNNSIDEEHYRRQREEVKKMGLDPDTILHDKPSA